ncbi:MAG: bL28 family ribosomal protein [Patescibacteria group bacterium]
MAQCLICRKRAHTGSLVSHAQNHTKRKFKPNLQKVGGILVCTQCLRTLKKYQNLEKVAQTEKSE